MAQLLVVLGNDADANDRLVAAVEDGYFIISKQLLGSERILRSHVLVRESEVRYRRE